MYLLSYLYTELHRNKQLIVPAEWQNYNTSCTGTRDVVTRMTLI